MQRPGFFLTLEGVDGSGKTTAMEFLKNKFESAGLKVWCTREPGGTPIADRIRAVLFNDWGGEVIDPLTEILLFSAARNQHIKNVIEPKLEEGYVVISDRYVDSMMAYQGAARKLSYAAGVINKLVVKDCMPTSTFYFKVDLTVAMQRSAARGEENYLDAESRQFKKDLITAYDDIQRANHNRVIAINANNPIEDVQVELSRYVDTMINLHKSMILANDTTKITLANKI